MSDVYLSSGRHDATFHGHPWIYANQLHDANLTLTAGEIVNVYSHKKRFLGKGFVNPLSQIRIRLLTRGNEEINDEFFYGKLLQSLDYRKTIGYENNFRLVHGEGDGLPSLIIDKFTDVLVLQTLSAGMDYWKPAIVRALKQIFPHHKYYERNDAAVRKLEGLEETRGFTGEPFTTIFPIHEPGAQFWCDVEKGQKTGFFLDQKENRLKLKNLVKGKRVLDCFCYTGSFSVYASLFGARSVTAIDSSEWAIEQARNNFILNHLPAPEFEVANAFDELPNMLSAGNKFDVAIVDPPAFTKNRSGIPAAMRGYREVNLRAMKLLDEGGFLITFSCSHFMSPAMFFEMLSAAAADAHKKIREVYVLRQAPDHPISWHIPETFYLKGYVLQLHS
jgi:23S rRNA (cytosine1962-C5)-methyltransferase